MAQRNEATEPVAGNAPPKGLGKALEFLKAKDDTSRFVGLALMKPLLEAELGQRGSTEEKGTGALIEQCWRAIPVKFLDRLLKAKPDGKKTKEEADSMVGLAVAVLHTFLMFVEAPEKDDRFVGRLPLLMSALRSTPPGTTTQIMQILGTLAPTKEGSQVIFGARDKDGKLDERPESYIFITVLLIDIRSTIPSLQEKLHSAEYPDISERITNAYEIISAFIGFLVHFQAMDSDNEDEGPGPMFSAPMPVDLLMKLRTNISEVMSLTIEHLRDRYDSSTAGAAGLHPSARTPNRASSNPLPIAWDTSSGMTEDPLTLSQLRPLSLWLSGEENDALRREASGIMDVLLFLYQDTSNRNSPSAVLLSLEGIIEIPEGIDAFLREEGWAILAADLEHILRTPPEHAHGIEIVRILLRVVEADVTGPAKEEWMSIVNLARQSVAHTPPNTTDLELGAAICQLAVELMVRAPRNIRKRERDTVVELRQHAEALLARVGSLSGDVRDGLEEVVQGLDSLSF